MMPEATDYLSTLRPAEISKRTASLCRGRTAGQLTRLPGLGARDDRHPGERTTVVNP
jgi:hypothetical protein